jgi:hypothetical protein
LLRLPLASGGRCPKFIWEVLGTTATTLLLPLVYRPKELNNLERPWLSFLDIETGMVVLLIWLPAFH